VIAASLTLLGEATAPRVLTRSGARRGDGIYVTGTLGGSLASGHHFRFTPRLQEGAWLARQADVSAMMDVSDGLAKDLHALTPRGMNPALIAESIPIRPGCDLRAALTDGEDYELLFVLRARADRANFARRWQRSFPKLRLSCIGQWLPAEDIPTDAVPLRDFRGYEHLR
jgi:thiamine-monophosphate kinase